MKRFCSGSRFGVFVRCSYAAKKKPPVPQAGSQIVIPGVGRMTSTIARISGLGVKYWPAPDFVSSAFFWSRIHVVQPPRQGIDATGLEVHLGKALDGILEVLCVLTEWRLTAAGSEEEQRRDHRESERTAERTC